MFYKLYSFKALIVRLTVIFNYFEPCIGLDAQGWIDCDHACNSSQAILKTSLWFVYIQVKRDLLCDLRFAILWFMHYNYFMTFDRQGVIIMLHSAL